MYDTFVPVPGLLCPTCGAALPDFQGKDGPCLLLIWQQGIASPVGCDVDEISDLDEGARQSWLETFSLPQRFTFYDRCEGCTEWVVFTGFCENGTWTESVLGDHLNEGPTVPAHALGSSWRQCSACTHAWEQPDDTIRAGCPSCGVLTHLTPR
ncbi:MAG: hypothetical protein R3B72_45015 [Polyangiaceae bacterium]